MYLVAVWILRWIASSWVMGPGYSECSPIPPARLMGEGGYAVEGRAGGNAQHHLAALLPRPWAMGREDSSWARPDDPGGQGSSHPSIPGGRFDGLMRDGGRRGLSHVSVTAT